MIAIHGGAGFHFTDEHKVCAKVLKACKYDLVKAIMELEKNTMFNCGYGSNLTIKGKVECEAAYMSSKQLAFGAVGCVRNCATPVFAAKSLSRLYESENDFGLIPPMILVGQGADDYCTKIFLECEIVENEQLISPSASIQRAKALETMDKSNNSIDKLDTVGGVFIHTNGQSESCVSSGGIVLKHDGRLGHCCQFGAGIWSEQRGENSVSVSLSGCGETLFRTHLAKMIAELFFTINNNDNEDRNVLFVEKLRHFFIQHFVNSPLLDAFPMNRRLFGGLLLTKIADFVELIVFHNTSHFVFAYLDKNLVVKCRKSRLSGLQDILCESFIL